MKFIPAFCFLFIYGLGFSQYFDTEVSVCKPQSYNDSYYFHLPGFNDRYSQMGENTFSFGNTDFYKRKNVKHVEVRDMQGELHFFWDRDTLGRILQWGQQQANYFMIRKTSVPQGMRYSDVIEYWQTGQLMRVDSIFNDYFTYESADTSFAYGLEERTQYMRGSLVNEQNRYYNEKYEGKYRSTNEIFFVMDSHKLEPYLYFEENFKTDYDSLTLYKTSHTRYASGIHHYIGETQQEWDSVSSHPLFKHLDTIPINDHFVDGVDFNEPLDLQQRMWCGNSLYDQTRYRNYDDGIRHYYSKNDLGLQDTFYIDFYPEDPNPSVAETNVTTSDPNVNPNIILMTTDYYRSVRRLSVPVRTPKFVYYYEYFLTDTSLKRAGRQAKISYR